MSQLSIHKPGPDPYGWVEGGFWTHGVELEVPSRSGTSRLHRDPSSLVRPRLISALHARWRQRVTVLVAGPGFGKTTLLIHTMTENRLAPQGEDVWIALGPHDGDGDSLALAVATALGRTDADESAGRSGLPAEPTAAVPGQLGRPTDPATVAELVGRHRPREACLVFDDVHLLPAGSAGAAWLAEFVGALPADAHVVLASRVEPAIPLARLRAQGAVLRLGHDDLLFTQDELAAFATARGVDPERLAGTYGWPALAELTANAQPEDADAFLWEEVLEPLGPDRRHVLAVVCDLSGADDRLVSAALGTRVDLSRALAGVPLVATGSDGWREPHVLWNQVPALTLEEAERVEVRRRAVVDLTERGRLDAAFALLSEVGLWDLAPAVLRATCLAGDRLGADRLGRWLRASPDTVLTSPAGRLATGLLTARTVPEDAIELLHDAAARCREVGDVDAELVAIGQLGRLAWYREAPTLYGDELAPRLAELATAGHPRAQALAAFCRATAADLAGDDRQVLAELSGIETGALDPKWEVMAAWLCGVVRLSLGDADAVCELVDRFEPTSDPVLKVVLQALRLRAWWNQGQVEEVLHETPALLTATRAVGVAAGTHIALTIASTMFSYVGDLTAARQCLDDCMAMAPRSLDGYHSPVRTSIALAALRLAEGDEDRAAASLRDAIDAHGLDQSANRRGWRQALPLSYVLVPETRDHWDSLTLHGYLRVARDLAEAVVAVREGRGGERLAVVDVPHPGLVRTVLHHRFAVQLAAGLSAAGRSEGATVLEAVGAAGRMVLRSAATTRSHLAEPAKALLAAVPAPPPHPLYLAVLGSLELRRDGPEGDEITNTHLRRKRVRELLAFLVGHRNVTRATIAAALWPGLDVRTSGNNLAVTLNYLLRALDPWRPSGEPTCLVRLDGHRVKLVIGPHLQTDVDDFDNHMTAAAGAETDGTPSLALEHYLAAVGLYRDALFSDLPDSVWIRQDRERYSSRFVHAATRAGQLLQGRGDSEQAEMVARRAVDTDPSAEQAHAVLVSAALDRSDVLGGRRQLEQCMTVLADLRIEPSAATYELHQRLHGG